MTYKQKNIMFIKLKNDLINKKLKRKKIIYPENIKPYLIDDDIDYINRVDTKEHRRIYDKICNYILNIGVKDIGSTTCFFCVKVTGRCESCEYAKNHGECGSDYRYVNTYDFLIDKGIKISNNEYREILKKINEPTQKNSK